jgi:hypothetical protein
LYVTPRGLATSAIPFRDRSFELEFDFLDHRLVLRTSDGAIKSLPLAPQTVSDFYRDFMKLLKSAGIEVSIWKMPVEVPDPIAFDKDTVHASYDRESVGRFFRALSTVNTLFHEFRSGFLGKCSPVHFFWGSFDLAVTRFSGKRAPVREGIDHVTLEAYSHEVISAGFWPGGGGVPSAAFYSYAAPAADGYAQYKVRPAKAYFDPKMGEYLLSYDDVRKESSPSKALMEFLQSTYEAGAISGKWDRQALERIP